MLREDNNFDNKNLELLLVYQRQLKYVVTNDTTTSAQGDPKMLFINVVAGHTRQVVH